MFFELSCSLDSSNILFDGRLIDVKVTVWCLKENSY